MNLKLQGKQFTMLDFKTLDSCFAVTDIHVINC